MSFVSIFWGELSIVLLLIILSLEDGLGNMPQLDVPLKGKVTLRQLIATGLNQAPVLPCSRAVRQIR